MLLLLSACSRARFDFTFSDELTEVKAIASARRDAITRPALDEARQLAALHTPGEIDVFDPIFYIDCSICWSTLPLFNPVGFCAHGVIHGAWEDNILMPNVYDISQSRAIQDAELFFAALASGYGMYHYLGGDAVFLPVFSEILTTLKTQERWQVDDFFNLLYKNISPLIIDYHFILGGSFFSSDYVFFTFDGIFNRSAYGFYNPADGRYVYAIQLPEMPYFAQPLEDILRLSMDETGMSFFYVPVIMLCTRAIDIPERVTVLYTDGTQAVISLKKMDAYRREIQPPSLEIVQGIPVVTIDHMLSHFGHYTHNQADAVSFLNFAVQLQDEPVFILDLRHNRGGFGATPLTWFNLLMGENIPSSYISLNRLSDAQYRQILGGGQASPEHISILSFRPDASFDAYHQIQNYPPHRIVPHDQLIIVLTGRRTASAGERMVDLALNMRNTLVIGQNTAGVYTTARNSWRPVLPNSRIRFEFATGMNIFPDGHFREGVGFAPDIWVTGCALTAALGMIEHHVQW